MHILSNMLSRLKYFMHEITMYLRNIFCAHKLLATVQYYVWNMNNLKKIISRIKLNLTNEINRKLFYYKSDNIIRYLPSYVWNRNI